MKLKFKRIVLKISGEALGASANPIDFELVERAASQIAQLQKSGVEVGIVLGGGNIWRGRSSGDMERNRADHMGMLATVINSLAMQDALERLGAPCRLFSSVQMQRVCDTFSARAAQAALDEGKIAIFAGGSGSPFVTTDTAAALRAAEVHADALFLAKNVDAVYSADPRVDANAVRYSRLSYDDVVQNNLKATDLTAITFCREQAIPIILFSMHDEKSIISAAMGANVGTIID